MSVRYVFFQILQKKTEKSNFLNIFGKINVLASPRQCDFTFSKNRKLKIACSVCFLPDRTKKTEKSNVLKIFGKINVLASPRQCDFTFPKN